MVKLFPHLPFQGDETPVSWAARMSALHGSPSLRSFLSDQGVTPSELLHGRRAVIERLCEVGGQDPAPVWRNTASSEGRESFRLRGENIPASMLSREETRFCPLCLCEDDAGGANPGILRRDRLIWSLRLVTTCSVHRLPLIYRGREHRESMPHKLILRVPERGNELLALAEDAPRREASPLQSYVLGRLEGHKGPEWLDDQSLEQALRATQMLGLVMAFGTAVNLGSVDRNGWDLAGRMGWEWVAKGKNGLHAAFRELQGSAFARGHGGRTISPCSANFTAGFRSLVIEAITVRSSRCCGTTFCRTWTSASGASSSANLSTAAKNIRCSHSPSKPGCTARPSAKSWSNVASSRGQIRTSRILSCS